MAERWTFKEVFFFKNWRLLKASEVTEELHSTEHISKEDCYFFQKEFKRFWDAIPQKQTKKKAVYLLNTSFSWLSKGKSRSKGKYQHFHFIKWTSNRRRLGRVTQETSYTSNNWFKYLKSPDDALTLGSDLATTLSQVEKVRLQITFFYKDIWK